MKLIFDFDFTLFQTSKLRQALEEMYVSCGVPREIFYETLMASRGDGRDWKPSVQLAILAKRYPLDVKFCEVGLDACVRRSPEFFFEDAIPCLREFHGKHRLFLVTYGEDSHQNTKINYAGISNFFDKIIITKDIAKVSAVSEIAGDRGGDSVFIEDNPLALRESKKAFPLLVTVRINRGEGRYTEEPSGEGIDFEITNLEQLKDILSNQHGNSPHKS